MTLVDRLKLRPATEADSEFVYDVTESAMRPYVEQAFGPWVESFQRELIGQSFDPKTHQIVTVDGTNAGLMAVSHHDTHIQLEKLYLLPTFQRRGIGSSLLKELIQSVVPMQKPVRLRVLAINAAARRLYEGVGFVVTGAEPPRLHMEYNSANEL